MTKWIPTIMHPVFITLITLDARSRLHDQMDVSNIMHPVFITLISYSTHAIL